MEIRQAVAEDAPGIEGVRLAGWQTAYRGIIPDTFLDALTFDIDRRARMIADESATTWIALDPGPVGMAVRGPCRDEDLTHVDELYGLYVHPTAWRTGVGGALLERCGDVRVLWVLERNVRARAFYGRHGFRPDGAMKVLDLDAPVEEIRMVRHLAARAQPAPPLASAHG